MDNYVLPERLVRPIQMRLVFGRRIEDHAICLNLLSVIGIGTDTGNDVIDRPLILLVAHDLGASLNLLFLRIVRRNGTMDMFINHDHGCMTRRMIRRVALKDDYIRSIKSIYLMSLAPLEV